jgi:hypothetical protein
MKTHKPLTRFLFEPDDPVNLGIARFFVFLALAKSIAPSTTAAMAGLPTELMRPPFGTGFLFPALPMDPAWIYGLGWLLRGLALAAAVGFLTRTTTILTTVGAWFYLAIPHLFGHVSHTVHHLVWFGSILALSRCGDAMSVDALLGRRTAGPPSARYGFPLRAIWLILGISFFFAGLWKIVQSGPDWFLSENLSNLSAKRIYATGAEGIAWLHGWPAHLGGLLTIVFEMGFVFALFFPVGRWILFVTGLMFHAGALITFKISFIALVICYPILLDNAAILRWLRSRLSDTRVDAVPVGPAPPSRAVLALGAFWIVSLLLAGALRVRMSWPIGAFPRFGRIHTPNFTSYVARGTLADGSMVEVRDNQLGGGKYRYHLYRLVRLDIDRALAFDERGDLEDRWRLLCAIAWRDHPLLQPAEKVEFVLVDVDLAAGPGQARIVRERIAFVCDPELPSQGR